MTINTQRNSYASNSTYRTTHITSFIRLLSSDHTYIILKITGKSVGLNTTFPVVGMSGVVVHDYGNELEAITSRLVQNSATSTSLISTDIIHHDELPTIKTTVKPGDKVIGGYLDTTTSYFWHRMHRPMRRLLLHISKTGYILIFMPSIWLR